MTPPTTRARVNPSDETIHLGPLAVRFLVTGEDARGSVAIFELTVPAAQRLAAPAHSHDHYEETINGIEGVLSWTVDGTRVDVGPGQALCIPRGAVHRFDNHGGQDAVKQVDGRMCVKVRAYGRELGRLDLKVDVPGKRIVSHEWKRIAIELDSRLQKASLRLTSAGS